MRVRGHGLQNEGAPYLADESGGWSRVGLRWMGVSGTGRGICSCGKASPIFDSAHQRKKWHRAHKEEMSRQEMDR